MSTPEAAVTTRQTPPPGITKDDMRDLFKEFITNRNVSPEQGGAQLMADNAELRADKRTLKAKVEDLEKKVPPDGALVLMGDDAKNWPAISEILKALPEGKRTPEELSRLLKEHGTLSDKVATLEKNQLAIEIAEAEDWKVSTLLKLTAGMDLLVEEVDEDVDDPENEGEKKKVRVKRGFINVRDAQGNVTSKKRLSEELSEFLPSLAKGDGTSNEEEHGTDHGTDFVRQSRGDKAPTKKGNVSKDFLAKRYKKPGDK